MSGQKRPNFLIIMSDEHGPMFSSTYGHPIARTPSMDRLAREGATFDAAYCNSPLCIPSRLSFMTGRHVSQSKGWDNASPLPPDAMTWPYLLRSEGYDCALSGKMHLIGADQLHGFQEQLAYEPHSTPNKEADPVEAEKIDLPIAGKHYVVGWEKGLEAQGRRDPWPSVVNAGPGTTPMIDADDLIEERALEYLRHPGRQSRPFALCVGFVAPHFPFVVPEPYFSMYYPENVDMPEHPTGHLENLPPGAKRLVDMYDFDQYSDEQIRRSRAAYYGLITYLDDKIGRLLDALDEEGLTENTVVVHTSDHGESLGQHNLWRKMNFYEESARVPLQIRWQGVVAGGQRISKAVSLVDVSATIAEMAGVDEEQRGLLQSDGESLVPLLTSADADWKDEAFCELLAHGTIWPSALIRQGNWKLFYTHSDPSEIELYNVADDPGEFTNLADDPAHADVQQHLVSRIMELWGDADELHREIVASQKTRQLIRELTGDDSPF